MMTPWPDIRLTPLSLADADQMNEWQNDPDIRELLMGFRGPVSPETTREWVASLPAQNLKSRVVFGIREGDRLAGMVNLFGLDWLHRSAKLGLFIGSPADRGKGLGYAACALILDYAFAGLDLERVMLEVLSENPARRVYERLNFRLEGVMAKAYYYRGQRADVVIYGLLKPEWQWQPPPEAKRLVGGYIRP